MVFENTKQFAHLMDKEYPSHKNDFYHPKNEDGKTLTYLCGNSLGLQPGITQGYVLQEMEDWARLGVEGHWNADNPWLPYHESLSAPMAKIVGAKTNEVVVMSSLTENLHKMLTTFYRPTTQRHKILMVEKEFPSDIYAVKSQMRLHGYNPDDSLLYLKAKEGEWTLKTEDILDAIAKEGDSIATILIGNTNYLTGQAFDLKAISIAGHKKRCFVGADCAHGAGNILLNLHDSGVDFAVWCSYKYLNSGPGSLAGCFVHEKHHGKIDLARLEGWWGHNKNTRFEMSKTFDPIDTVEAWQLSNPPILSMAAVKASLKIFEEAGIENLRKKSIQLTNYCEYLLKQINTDRIKIITPSDANQRGCQLSLEVKDADKNFYDTITEKGIICDWREPNVIRIAPTPLYNTFKDVWSFYKIMSYQLEK